MINYYIPMLYSREGNGIPFQYSCLANPMDGGAWQAALHGVAKSCTCLSDFTFTFHFHALEREMATHSSVLAWRIPGRGEPWWAAVYGVAQSQTQLKRLSSSSSRVALTLKKKKVIYYASKLKKKNSMIISIDIQKKHLIRSKILS